MLVLRNANIYTLDAALPKAGALALESGRIVAVGTEQQILDGISRQDTVVDLAGMTVMPGLVDAHFHLETYAFSLQFVDCEVDDRSEVLRRVAERARRLKPGEWVLGHGWNQNNWPEGFGTKELLDAAAPDNPVWLTAKSLHAGWASSEALRIANVGPSSPEPMNGRIGRDPNGSPDGILFESAMNLIDKVLPDPTVEDAAQTILAAQESLWKVGLTGVHDFDRQRCFGALQILDGEDRLGLRVLKSIPWEALDSAADVELRAGFGSDFLRIGQVKGFSDGALGPHTAAMLQGYEDEPSNRGILMLDAEEVFEKGRLAVEHGLSLAIHAIGDRAIHEILEAYEHLRRYERESLQGRLPAKGFRHRIEHVQVIHPDDAGRLAALGVIASMQPVHVVSDMLMADKCWGKRAALSYALKTQIDHGAHFAFGSDAPVESPNPFWGLHAAVTRRRRDGTPGPEGWYPEQKLSFVQALEGFTSGAAYAAGLEDRQGKLKPGYYADLIVLERDPFSIAPDELYKILPVRTMVNGQWVFGA